MFELFSNAALQGLSFGLATLGLSVAFRVVRYPDLSGEGSFVLGAVLFATTTDQFGWAVALALSGLIGGLAGLFTALLNARFGVGRLLSGIITAMIAYSIAFRIMGGQSNIGLLGVATMFDLPLPAVAVAGSIALVCILVVRMLVASESGLVMRATGHNETLVASLGHSPARFRASGLCLANVLIGIAGAVVAAQQGFADVGMGQGTLITIVAALVIGEQVALIFRLPWNASMMLSPFIGASLYFLLYLIVLRASFVGIMPFMIGPTALKMIAGLCIILVIAIRRRKADDEQLPI